MSSSARFAACSIRRDDRLALLIQYMERDWFEEWVREHAPPPGANIVSPESLEDTSDVPPGTAVVLFDRDLGTSGLTARAVESIISPDL